MSTLLGDIRQLGYVVRDIEAAMHDWSERLGVGPWFYNPRVPIENYRYRGESFQPHNSVALANSGPLQVELIQTRNDVPSMYRDFARGGRTGPQHVAYWTERFDADLARMQAQGHVVVMSGEVGERGRFVYFEADDNSGTVIELSEVAGPKGRMFSLIREAAVDWDGRNPVRAFPDLRRI